MRLAIERGMWIKQTFHIELSIANPTAQLQRLSAVQVIDADGTSAPGAFLSAQATA